MKPTANARTRVIPPVAKIRKAKAILSAKIDTCRKSPDLVIADAKIRKMLLSAKGRAHIDDVYRRLTR